MRPPNGAGKSTALAILVGLRRPDSGSAWLFGQPPSVRGARRPLGYAGQDCGFPLTLTVREVVELVRSHFPEPRPTQELLERFGLQQLRGRRCGGLSGGERRRLGLALAFAGGPRLVVLDEPGADLDVEGRDALSAAVRTLAEEGGATLLTTHVLAEAEALASRIVILDRGAVVADGSPAAVRGTAETLAEAYHRLRSETA